jgi:hypothetical protein
MTTTTETLAAPAFVHIIKVRKKGDKQWSFLTSKGGTNRLRIHAACFQSKEKAQSVIDENAAENTEWEWKVTS